MLIQNLIRGWFVNLGRGLQAGASASPVPSSINADFAWFEREALKAELIEVYTSNCARKRVSGRL